jgi:sporulation protein YlmC with PRC-barrel domain
VTLSDLLGVEVRTESGEILGRVFDLRAEAKSGRVEVLGVVVRVGAPRTSGRA